ncbi:ubiquinol-cytochrome c reductase [Acetobacter orientalis]|uniref:Ubiquinol-cytochrome c reductase n=1 Tax=Acetobacter orientalis TaxID=146474 RepID=A0A2Z5ZN23_9PROT|nr:ubiquinol-cytochrome c reductase [Acetobacter orientalis]
MADFMLYGRLAGASLINKPIAKGRAPVTVARPLFNRAV